MKTTKDYINLLDKVKSLHRLERAIEVVGIIFDFYQQKCNEKLNYTDEYFVVVGGLSLEFWTDIDSISEDGSSVESDSTFFGAEAKEVENSEEKEENVAVAAETEKSEQTNNSSTVIIFAVVIGVVLVLAYRKFKGSDASGYDED